MSAIETLVPESAEKSATEHMSALTGVIQAAEREGAAGDPGGGSGDSGIVLDVAANALPGKIGALAAVVTTGQDISSNKGPTAASPTGVTVRAASERRPTEPLSVNAGGKVG